MTEYAEALAAFKASNDWIKSADPVSLGASVAMQLYLENRLITAFQAGWLARARLQATALPMGSGSGQATATHAERIG